MADNFQNGVKYQGDGAYFYDGPPWYQDTSFGMPGYGATVRTQGDIIRALTRWYEMSGDKKALDLARKLVNYTLGQIKYWTPEADPKAVVSAEHAHFSGHLHENMVCMMGLLPYAQVTDDPPAEQFVRDGYEYLRNWGLPRIGMFGETWKPPRKSSIPRLFPRSRYCSRKRGRSGRPGIRK